MKRPANRQRSASTRTAAEVACPRGRARTVGIAAGRGGWTFADVTPPIGLDVTDVTVEGERYSVFAFPISILDDLSLTRAERQVVLGILRGMSNADLAAVRAVSPRTIANQLGSIYRKLSITSRGELLALIARCRMRRRPIPPG